MMQKTLIHQLAEMLKREHEELSLEVFNTTPRDHRDCATCTLLRQAEEASVTQDVCACYPKEAYDES